MSWSETGMGFYCESMAVKTTVTVSVIWGYWLDLPHGTSSFTHYFCTTGVKSTREEGKNHDNIIIKVILTLHILWKSLEFPRSTDPTWVNNALDGPHKQL